MRNCRFRAPLEGKAGRVPEYGTGVIRKGNTCISHTSRSAVRLNLQKYDGRRSWPTLGNGLSGNGKKDRKGNNQCGPPNGAATGKNESHWPEL
jgi:hypothetical protein